MVASPDRDSEKCAYKELLNIESDKREVSQDAMSSLLGKVRTNLIASTLGHWNDRILPYTCVPHGQSNETSAIRGNDSHQ